MGKFYCINLFNKIFQNVCIFSVFTYFPSIFGIWWGGVCLVAHGSSETFALVCLYFVNGLVSTNLYSCLSMETLYFLHSLYSLVKLNKWYTFKSYIKERFWFIKKSQIWQKQYVMICYASSGSVLQLLHILSSRFTAILVYVPFLLLPLCDVIYVWFLTVNII